MKAEVEGDVEVEVEAKVNFTPDSTSASAELEVEVAQVDAGGCSTRGSRGIRRLPLTLPLLYS